MPRAKSDVHHTYRIELQQTERESLELLTASLAARNVTAAVGNILTPFTTATVAGMGWTNAILAALYGIKESEEAQKIINLDADEGILFNLLAGPFWGGINMLSSNEVKNKVQSFLNSVVPLD